MSLSPRRSRIIRSSTFHPKPPVDLPVEEGGTLSTSTARLTLAEIPIVCLRSYLPASLLSSQVPYSETVRQAQAIFKPRQMTVDRTRCMLLCQDVEVSLPLQEFALAAWLARQRVTHGSDYEGVRWDVDDWSGWLDEYRALPDVYPEAVQRMQRRIQLERDVVGRQELKGFFEQKLSRLRAKIRNALGGLAYAYEPRTTGKRGEATVGFALAPEAISFVE